MWLSAEEALQRLHVKPQTLYANVSRGRIRAKADPADTRRSLYRSEDVDRLAGRPRGRRSATSIASGALDWGEPVLASAISTIAGGRLIYRGVDASLLAETATLEDAAALLWDVPSIPGLDEAATDAVHGLSLAAPLEALAARAAVDPPSAGRGAFPLRQDAGAVFRTVATSLLGAGSGPLHLRLAGAFGRQGAADLLRRALVLLADHELNASTLAARVAVSAGASLSAGALAALATLSGSRHGNAARAVLALAEDIAANPVDPVSGLRDWLGEGRIVPGFGHPAYPDGDIRCAALLAQIDLPPAFRNLREAGLAVLDDAPNIDFALAALAAAHGLPPEAPVTIFALARTAGWLAHMLEQAESGTLIRPRARYIGPSPTVP
ncbi:MAG TPA: citrate/2-methylcitrate synthase [Devosia sp.]|nr:citrate/2-methylcitrate synthase [Devosia sp.]